MNHTFDDKKKYNIYYSSLITDIAENASRSAFKELYSEFYPRIKSYLRSLKVNPEVIDDLAQDVMATIWRKAEQYNAEKAAPITWIFTISRNRFIDTYIRKKKHTFTEQDASFFMNDADDPSENLNRINNHTLLIDALKKITPEQANLIKMVYFQEKTHNEVADATNLPLGTVKSRIRTALASLRKYIAVKEFKDC
ncbi:MAG: RNA polymerase sigma-70 factor (ECF subfamily) [Alphaproteobacteria bacterium]|jgi:RNA polymerase sigma-70 factor (ECF subfamily)